MREQGSIVRANARALILGLMEGIGKLMIRMTGGAAIVKSLQAYGIETLFGIPGVQLDELFVALYDERELLRLAANEIERLEGELYNAYYNQ